nr:MAG TPA: Cro/C1-type HTH DNA-binding domain protein [Caudoviricetes sp.]
MLVYKINVIDELQKIGVNTSLARKTGIFSQSTMKKFRDGDTAISCDALNRLCAVLEMQPRDILKYIETDYDRNEIITKKSEK